MNEQASRDANLVFVVGVFRSGTSLLYALLNQHSQIALMYECNVWDFPEILSRPRFRRDWRGRLEFFGRALSRHRLIFGKNLQGLENANPHDLYRIFGETKEARFYGEKSPFYCARLRQLARNHPGCSFILIWRDAAEIHRSIQDAGRRSHFFRRRGMLSRMIFHQEQMIRQASDLARSGCRIHHVTYAALVDRTEESCRNICAFLGVEFENKMIDLAAADLYSVFRAPQHDYLRRGKIERRHFSKNGLDERLTSKLHRFSSRWNRLRREQFNHPNTSPQGLEPSALERLYHGGIGRFLDGADGCKRALFEFLPLPWLRTYRRAKEWFLAGDNMKAAKHNSLRAEFLANMATILLSFLIIAVVATADFFTGFTVSLMPFYMVPAAILSLAVNQRWGTFAALVSSLAWAGVQTVNNPFVNMSHFGVLAWDAAMRFLVIEFVVLLLERIRVEIENRETSAD